MFKWPWYLPHPDIFSFWMANVALQLFKTPAKHSGLQNQQGSNVSTSSMSVVKKMNSIPSFQSAATTLESTL